MQVVGAADGHAHRQVAALHRPEDVHEPDKRSRQSMRDDGQPHRARQTRQREQGPDAVVQRQKRGADHLELGGAGRRIEEAHRQWAEQERDEGRPGQPQEDQVRRHEPELELAHEQAPCVSAIGRALARHPSGGAI
jgi:hypothetical protein